MQIFEAVDSGELTESEAGMLVRSFLSAGIDTTVYGLGNALYCFARYPEQWAILRENPALIRGAFEEVLRFEAPVQTFFRTTTKAVDVSGVKIGDGEKVLLFLAAANRDPRRWERPDLPSAGQACCIVRAGGRTGAAAEQHAARARHLAASNRAGLIEWRREQC
jgi:cytochrome P450